MGRSVLLLVGVVGVVVSSFEGELRLDAPHVVIDVIDVQVFVRVVPADHIEVVVVIEHIVGETSDFRKHRVSLHQVLLHVEAEAFLCPDCLVEAAKDDDRLAVDWHTHRQVTGCPGALRAEGNHAPHIVVYIIHFDGVCDFLFVKLGPPTEDVDVLVVEDATRG